jgi:hypothetical protein
MVQFCLKRTYSGDSQVKTFCWRTVLSIRIRIILETLIRIKIKKRIRIRIEVIRRIRIKMMRIRNTAGFNKTAYFFY